jgi:hypothetical protein
MPTSPTRENYSQNSAIPTIFRSSNDTLRDIFGTSSRSSPSFSSHKRLREEEGDSAAPNNGDGDVDMLLLSADRSRPMKPLRRGFSKSQSLPVGKLFQEMKQEQGGSTPSLSAQVVEEEDWSTSLATNGPEAVPHV